MPPALVARILAIFQFQLSRFVFLISIFEFRVSSLYLRISLRSLANCCFTFLYISWYETLVRRISSWWAIKISRTSSLSRSSTGRSGFRFDLPAFHQAFHNFVRHVRYEIPQQKHLRAFPLAECKRVSLLAA